MENKKINVADLEKLKELLKKIDPNGEIFVKGYENLDIKLKELKKGEQETN